MNQIKTTVLKNDIRQHTALLKKLNHERIQILQKGAEGKLCDNEERIESIQKLVRSNELALKAELEPPV